MWVGEKVQIHQPTEAPTTSYDQAIPWVGPVQEGDFTFRFTYVLGREDQEWQDAPLGVRDPLWESAMSPESATAAYTDHAGFAIQIHPTNIAALLGFSATGQARDGKAGWRIRIYVSRKTVETGGLGSAAYNPVEDAGRYYLLDEVEPDGTVAPAYSWDGSVIPDLDRRLNPVSGYRAWHVFPLPDQRYELDFRAYRRPHPLEVDSDEPPLRPGAASALIQLALYNASLMDGVDVASAEVHFNHYKQQLRQVRAVAEQGAVTQPGSIVDGRLGVWYTRFTQT